MDNQVCAAGEKKKREAENVPKQFVRTTLSASTVCESTHLESKLSE